MRAFLRARDATSVLTKLVSILRCLPDGILVTDAIDGPLYFNQRVKQLLQLYEEDEETTSRTSYSRVRITKGVQRQLHAKLREILQMP